MNPQLLDRIQRNWDTLPPAIKDRLVRNGLGPGGTTTPTTPNEAVPITTTPSLGNEEVAHPQPTGLGGTAARTAAAVVGGLAGGPLGAAGLTAAVDLGIQAGDVAVGAQEEINPGLTLVEAGSAAYVPLGKSVKMAAMTAGAFGATTDIARRLAEGKPIELDGQLALTTATSAMLGGVVRRFQNRAALSQMAQEITGDEHASAVMDDLLTRPQTDRTARETQRIARNLGISPEDVGRPGALSFDDPIAATILGEESTLPSIASKFPRGKKSRLPVRWRIARSFVPEETAMEAIEKNTGYTTYQDFNALNTRFEVQRTEVNSFAPELKAIFRGTSRRTRNDIAAALEFDDAVGAAKALNLASRDIDRVGRLKSVIQKIENKYGGNYHDFTRETDLLPDAIPRVNGFLRTTTFAKYLADDWATAFKKYVNVKNPDVRDQMMRVLNAMRGNPDKMTKDLSEGLTRVLGKLGIDKKVDARAISNQIVALNYAGTLGWRVSPIVRNTFQPIQTAFPYLGSKWTGVGFKQAFTKEGRAMAIASGAARGQALDIAEVDAIVSTPTLRGLKYITEKGLHRYQKVEEFVRSWTYLGQYHKTLDAAKKAGGNLAVFLDKSDIDRFQQGPQARIIGLYTAGKVKEAANEAARHLVTLTQFNYSGAARPKILTEYGPLGLAGRTFGGFGTWGMSYGAYLGDSFAKGRAQGPRWKVLRDLTRFVGANTAIAGTFALGGAALHDEDSIKDALGWTFFSPLIFTGGPAKEAFESALSVAQGALSGQVRQQSVRQLKRSAKTFIPGALAYDEFRQALDEPTIEEALGRLGGLKKGSK